MCTAVSLLTWVLLDLLYFKKISVIGAVNGMITGLVAITPAAGVVAGWGAILLGVGSGSVPWFTMNIVGKKLTFLERHFDDTLGIGHTHLISGLVGGVGTGLWATVDGCAAFGLTNPGGAVAGNGIQVAYQLAGAAFIFGWNAVWTSLIMLFIKYVLRIPLRMTEEQSKSLPISDYISALLTPATVLLGDQGLYSEEAYAFGPCEAHEGYIQGQHVGQSHPLAEDTELGVASRSAPTKAENDNEASHVS